MVTWSYFHTENSQILGATVKNIVTMALIPRDLCRPELAHVRVGVGNDLLRFSDVDFEGTEAQQVLF
jgi:hypothetical protein